MRALLKSRLLACSALALVAGAAAPGAMAADQAPAEPAAAAARTPSLQEELVYLRDIIALQTLRLDEAEQALARQTKMFEDQQRKIATLERALNQTQLALKGRGANVAAADFSGAGADGAYTVRQGDTLNAIAQRFGVSVRSLADANNIASPNQLKAGRTLVVPGFAPAVVAASEAPAAKVEKDPKAAPDAQRVAAAETPGPSPSSRPDVTERAIEQKRKDEPAKPADAAAPQEVGVRPADEDDRPNVTILSDVGGILTPKGTLFVEPTFDYTVSSDNRFFFQGVEIADAILIGAIEATDSDRRARTEGVGLRYGITDRLEVDGRISWVNRNDRISGVAIDDGTTLFRELNGSGVGDAEIGVHYQLTGGRSFPYTVLNLRAKAPTGTGPFDVDRDAEGIERELSSGSGFWTIEPSVTFILPSDPAVIFANIGYQQNLSVSPDEPIGNAVTIREFNPGDAIRASLGLGLAVNDRLSVNFGYDQSNFFRTTQIAETRNAVSGELTLSTVRQPPTAVGSFILGGSYTLNDRIRLNLNTAFGATDEAPDMRISLRAQVRLFD